VHVYDIFNIKKSANSNLMLAYIESLIGLVRPRPNYWRTWNVPGPFVDGSYYHYRSLLICA